MSTLRVLMPSWSQTGASPDFRQWLARGDRVADVQNVRATVLRELFHFAGDTIPVAALRHFCHADAAREGAWLCADPAWVRSEATGARLMACPLADLGEAEAATLGQALQPLFAEAGTPLGVDTPAAWCVRTTAAMPAVAWVDPVTALGANLLDCLPAGVAGRPWRRLFSETQVLLHAQPVNAARIAAGKHPVNALWFWGAGALPASVETGVQVVASVDDTLRGLAKLGGALRLEPLPAALESDGRTGAVLLDLDVPGQACAAADWLEPFRRWLRERRFDAIEFAFASGECLRVRPGHRLRFWRRP